MRTGRCPLPLVVAEASEVFITLLEVVEFLLGEHFVPRLIEVREIVGEFISHKFIENVAMTLQTLRARPTRLPPSGM